MIVHVKSPTRDVVRWQSRTAYALQALFPAQANRDHLGCRDPDESLKRLVIPAQAKRPVGDSLMQQVWFLGPSRVDIRLTALRTLKYE
jgi:hypothetical protein